MKPTTLGCSQFSLPRVPGAGEDALIPPQDPCFSVDRLAWILRTSTKRKNFADALHVYAYLHRNALETHSLLQSYIVSMFVEAGSMVDAHTVFDRMISPSEHSWNIIINGYIEYEQLDYALVLYKKMREQSMDSNGYHLVALLKACTKMKNVIKGVEIHDYISKFGLLHKDIFIGTTLIDMYSKCGLLDKSLEVFDKLRTKNVVTWNALIVGYAKHDCGEKALQLLERMGDEDVLPNAVTLLCCLNACASIEHLEKGLELHSEIARRDLLEGHSFIGNALVDMYAKCGSLSVAREVFSKLSNRDITSWNALIGGYVKCEHSEEALECVKQMQLDGVFPDAITFACSLKACGISENMEKGLGLHVEIESRGLLSKNIVLSNALVDMYGKCGMVAKAQEVFDRLSLHDVVSWNSLIGGYTSYECNEEALNCFEQMQFEGIFPDSLTFSCILKACGNMGILEKGNKIHAKILREGIAENDVVLGNALVSMYANCGELAKALEVFFQLLARNVVSYNAVIGAYAREDANEKILRCLGEMEEEGVPPNAITYSYILKACGNLGEIDQGTEVHADIARRGLIERDIVLGSPLVEMYAKFGLFSNALELFSKLMERDLFLWNALIAGYVNHGRAEVALDCFGKMESEGFIPDAITFTCILKACGSLGDVRQTLEMHVEIERRELLLQDLVLGNALVDSYAKCGLLTKAHEVLKRLPVRSAVCWSALIAGYAKYEKSEAALDCYKEMQIEGVAPDVITLACVLNACGSVVAMWEGHEIHAELERKGLSASDIILGNALVDMYAKCGYLRLAHELFDRLPVRDVVSWNALMSAYLNHEFGQDVLDCFNQMLLECVFPDAITYFSSLKACGGIGATTKGKEMHSRIVKQTIVDEDPMVGKALVDMYAKGGLPEKAQEVFDNLAMKSATSWNALISGYAQLGLVDNVLGTFERMIEDGDDPDSATFVSVLNACSHTGLVDEAASYFHAMSNNYGLIPIAEHVTCMIDLLGRTGQLDSAVAIMNGLPFHPDLVVSSTVLGACRKEGNLVLGRQVFEDARRVYIKDPSMYISMYNLYANAVR
ncbi:hypothetical protein GOP47_0027001 [Adiantum capillus-veneris]|nr:hypothetical protein GOP47_0027001 [Adiantum capillus-veneris]